MHLNSFVEIKLETIAPSNTGFYKRTTCALDSAVVHINIYVEYF